MKSGIVRHGRLPLCVLVVVSHSEISGFHFSTMDTTLLLSATFSF